MAKKVNKKTFDFKHRLLSVVIYGVFVFIFLQTMLVVSDIADKKSQISDVQQEVTQQRVENSELKRMIESGNSDEYIARIAREKYGLVMPDERVFINVLGE